MVVAVAALYSYSLCSSAQQLQARELQAAPSPWIALVSPRPIVPTLSKVCA